VGVIAGQISLKTMQVRQSKPPYRLSAQARLTIVCSVLLTWLSVVGMSLSIMGAGAVIDGGGSELILWGVILTFATIMILLFAPLYAAAMLVSTPDALPSKIITYFPLTSPIPLMLRNAIGNLSAMDAAISISILAVCAAIAIMMGVRLFRFGALEYSRKLSLREIFTRK